MFAVVKNVVRYSNCRNEEMEVASFTAAKVLATVVVSFPCPPLGACTTSGSRSRSLLRCPCQEQGSVYPCRPAFETSHPSSAMCVLGCCLAVKKMFLAPLLLLCMLRDLLQQLMVQLSVLSWWVMVIKQKSICIGLRGILFTCQTGFAYPLIVFLL